MKNNLLWMISGFFLASLLSCAGNGSEISTISGSATRIGRCVTARGPAIGAAVIAIPVDYAPFDSGVRSPKTTYTDDQGKFALFVDITSVNLTFFDSSKTLGAFVPCTREKDIGTVLLDSLGYIAGRVVDTSGHAYNVGISGTMFFTKTLESDSFFLPAVPASSYFVQAWQIGEKAAPINLPGGIKDSVRVLPGKTSIITIFQ